MAQLTLTYQEFDSHHQLPQPLADLLEAARAACNHSYAPYSKFHVGAALLLEGGEIISGANQENAASPAGLCAERNALYTAGYHTPQGIITTLAIAATRNKEEHQNLPVTPCGGCRQVLMEFQDKQQTPIQLLMPSTSGKYLLLPSVNTLLPFNFSASFMG